MTTQTKKRVIYWILAVSLLSLFATYSPYLINYYVLQPDTSVFTFFTENPNDQYYIFETVIIALFAAAVWCISGRVGVGLLVTGIPLLVLAYASDVKYAARRELFRLGDLKLTEAAGVAVNYIDFHFSAAQLRVIVAMLLFFVCGLVLDHVHRRMLKREREAAARVFTVTIYKGYGKASSSTGFSKRKGLIIRLLAGLCLLVVTVGYSYQFIKSKNAIENASGREIRDTENNRYVLYTFLRNDRLTDINIDHVDDSYAYFLGDEENYSEDRANRPNVIVVMNESWWNTDNILSDNVTFSTDPMEPYNELVEKCSSGSLTVNIFGGGTVSSETEFLTGLNTKYYVTGSGIYTQMQSHRVPSLVDYFSALDYETVAIHPYYGYLYGRKDVYELMGFDRMIFDEDMDYRDIYTRYISDESLAKQIIKEYEEGEKDRSFIFAVSIANHIHVLDYDIQAVEDYDYPIAVTVENASLSGEDYDALVNYVNGIYLANLAFGQLVEYFEGVDEPTVLVMFGDHMPGFSEEVIRAMGLDGDSEEAVKSSYSVPVLMWNNFGASEIAFVGDGVSYLPMMLIDYADLPDTDVAKILRQMRECFAADTREIMLDSGGQYIEEYSERQRESLNHFKVIDYDLLYGDESRDVWTP